MKRIPILALLTLSLATAYGDSGGVLGFWHDSSGSTIKIYRCGADVCASIAAIGAHEPPHVDSENPNPALRKRSLCNLQIGTNFHLKDPDHAEGGRLYDPESGKTYSGWMISSGNTLKLRGYIGISLFGRTETWTRAQGNIAFCHS